MVTSQQGHQRARASATTTPPTKGSRDIAPPNDDDSHALHAESNALTSLHNNLLYLYSPTAADKSARPARLRTRALLSSFHYLGVFIFWRLFRWAKYALVGSAVAALGSVAIAGSMASGIGFFIAPTGIFASIAVGTAWGVGKWVWRRIWRKRVQKERAEAGGNLAEVRYAGEPDLQAVPW